MVSLAQQKIPAEQPESKGNGSDQKKMGGRYAGVTICGPPWAPEPQGKNKEIAKSNPVDECLMKIAKGGRVGDARADFVVAAIRNGANGH
jgi:hypothetical protein